MDVGLRPAQPADRPFLLALYASTREAERALLPWDDARWAAFVEQQFAAQDAGWRAQHPGASRDVVLVDGRPAGRLYVAAAATELVVVDIALLPAARGRGIGTRLLRDVQAQAAGLGLGVALQVLDGNPAARLYERLGFVAVTRAEPYTGMRWPAQPKIAS